MVLKRYPKKEAPALSEKTEFVVFDIFYFSSLLSFLIDDSSEETPFFKSFFIPPRVVGRVNKVCSK
jgi:hypothetical protein